MTPSRWGAVLFSRLIWMVWLLLGAVTAQHLWAIRAGEPVAGLGTVAGHPSDRPVLPPPALMRWERTNDGVLLRE